MHAIEFRSIPHDNVVNIPAEFQEWNGRQVRIIMLDEEAPQRAEKSFQAASLRTRGFRFDRDEANAR